MGKGECQLDKNPNKEKLMFAFSGGFHLVAYLAVSHKTCK